MLSPSGTTEPRGHEKHYFSVVPDGTFRVAVSFGNGDESPAYYRSVHTGRKQLPQWLNDASQCLCQTRWRANAIYPKFTKKSETLISGF